VRVYEIQRAGSEQIGCPKQQKTPGAYKPPVFAFPVYRQIRPSFSFSDFSFQSCRVIQEAAPKKINNPTKQGDPKKRTYPANDIKEKFKIHGTNIENSIAEYFHCSF
jgi:hypothetical protein